MRPVFLLILVTLLNVLTATPRYIQPITHEYHEADYYAEQAREWKMVAEDPATCDDMAWYHYYLAAHFANIFGNEPSFNVSAIHLAAEEVLGENDFALHYLRCRQSATPKQRFDNLKAAYAAAPDRVESYPGLATYYLIEGDMVKYREFMRKIDARNPFPRGVMEWSYNQLQSVGENGVLITHGDNDTYATLLLQAVHEVRPDVSVVNLPLLTNFPTYRNRVISELNLATPTEDQLFYPELLEIITAGPRPVYLGVGAHDNLVTDQAHKLYLTGLTFRYAADSFNNLLPLVHNYRDQWRQDDLFAPLGTGPRQAVADQLNQNYLPALLELREYFQVQDPGEAKRLEVAVRRIANRSGLEDKIEEFLAPPPRNIASTSVALKARQIAKKFREIPAGNYQYQLDDKGNFVSMFPVGKEGIKTIELPGFWLQETEVSNADYQLFLEDLLRQRYFDLLDTVAIAEADYNQFLPKDQRDPSINSLYRERVELLHNHPVTSISHRAAELYATWLTEVYNQDPKRKDQVSVRFRLPTADEIAYAARGGRKYSPYPWGGPSVANAKGCFLANFNTSLIEHPINGKSLWDMVDKEKALKNPSSEPGCDFASDGGLLTVPVDAYFPNDYGIYNLSGNAAEMTSQDGVDVGGSWADHALDMEIGRRQKRTTPHPAVGFRLVMEYLE